MNIENIIKNIKNNEYLNKELLTKNNKNKVYYAVKQPDGNLKVVIPTVFQNKNFLKLKKYIDGIEGATQRVIEEIKKEIISKKRFINLAGYFSRRYRELYEPLTVVNCDLNIGYNLWRVDKYNYIKEDKIYLLLRMIFKEKDEKEIAKKIDSLLLELNQFIKNIDINILIEEAKNIINQKYIRENLDKLGLVCFIGNNSKPARKYTEVRKHYRIAGPKEINIPFVCPEELNPIEITPKYGKEIKGLGIKKKEIFIITGRNAQGKTTLLNAIYSGQDDHLIGDGREFIITTKSLARATTGSMEMTGQDISLFFDKLPPGVRGTPKSVYGTASGSMYMAYQIQRAIKNKTKLILIDEDNSAVNLLVSGVLSKWFEGVRSLSDIIMENRELLGESAFIIVTSSLDFLTALGDRAIYLQEHKPYYLDLDKFKKEVKSYYLKKIERL
ncbi:P-loop domain-containing protein [Methanocaldococcus indicus]|uniref:P-loop domain-containing protein n=1 Tax=Methanocaldococcus indicus TaxID=213231 RepID=UPI003C6D4E9B